MAKYKAGLHKKIASIFDGAPVPKNTGAPQPSHSPTPGRSGHGTQLKLDKGRLGNPASPEPPDPAPKIPTAPKQQPVQSLSKTTPSKPLKVGKNTPQTPWRQTLEQMKNKLFAQVPGVNTAKQKTMAMLVPILSIALIVVLVKVFIPSVSETHGFTKLGPTNIVAPSDKKNDWQIPDPYPTTLRDPMQFNVVTPAPGKVGAAELVVRGTVYSDDNPMALVGTQIVREGDQVSGATVIKINEHNVEFEMNGKRWKQKVQ